jgi:hypothetical protein
MVTKFKLGSSGNPRGRPRGSRNRKAIVNEIANQKQKIEEDGKQRWRCVFELVLIRIGSDAMRGNPKARRALHDFLERYTREPAPPRTYLFGPPMTLEEWQRMADEYIENQKKKESAASTVVRSVKPRVRLVRSSKE